MLDLSHIRTFLEVYREGSITKAAAKLHLSQPTVTQHVKALETQIGSALFERTPRGIAPTGHAHDLAARAAGQLDDLASLSAAQSGEQRSTTLHVAGPHEYVATFVAPDLVPLAREGVRVQAYSGRTADMLERLAEGAYDAVIALHSNDDPRLRFELLRDEELVLAAAPEWRDHDLDSVPLVAYDERLPVLRSYFLDVFGYEPRGQVVGMFPSQFAIRSFVARGGGMAVFPRYLVAAQLEAGELVLLHEPTTPPTLPYYLATRVGPRRALLERASALLAPR